MRILIAGGAGFIGSHIAEAFIGERHDVTVIDGCLPQTSGSPSNLAHLPTVTFIQESVEDCSGLTKLLDESDLLVDCVGWTRHLLAIDDPHYDLSLNVSAHLHLIKAVADSKCSKVIYLGSRGQFGQLQSDDATEDHPQVPADVQGVHKSAAESHWRLAAKRHSLDVYSILFGNTFGSRLPLEGADIGLIGSFIRSLLADEEVEIYGKGRMRDVVYAPDLARALVELSGVNAQGFQRYNLVGSHVTLDELVSTMRGICGTGSVSFEDFPPHIKQIDMGNNTLSDDKLVAAIGSYPKTALKEALSETFKSLKD